mmetsp:Transcript_20135/g.39553  ORF Transcript_20135/g.39553 Transcript_20135/m.39553 type:complete len:238 (-) Transcript_20135:2745-3458(-)
MAVNTVKRFSTARQKYRHILTKCTGTEIPRISVSVALFATVAFPAPLTLNATRPRCTAVYVSMAVCRARNVLSDLWTSNCMWKPPTMQTVVTAAQNARKPLGVLVISNSTFELSTKAKGHTLVSTVDRLLVIGTTSRSTSTLSIAVFDASNVTFAESASGAKTTSTGTVKIKFALWNVRAKIGKARLQVLFRTILVPFHRCQCLEILVNLDSCPGLRPFSKLRRRPKFNFNGPQQPF